MSATTRILSGSAASWVQMSIAIITQMALVPVYLSFWDVNVYGIWISIQALATILSTLDRGHQNFLGYEFLRIGKDNRKQQSLVLWSGVWIGIILGLIQIAIIGMLITTGLLASVIGSLNINKQIANEASVVLLLQGVGWLITGSVGGLFVRVLAPFGYFPRMAWWGVFSSLTTSLAPVVAVSQGAGLLTTGIVTTFATIIYNIVLYCDIFYLLKKENVFFKESSFKIGLNNFYNSTILSVKDLLDNVRQQGVRLILTPLVGAAELVAFVTMRTGANVTMQGLNSITNPMMPEMMRFLNLRDQIRSDISFGTIWIVVVVLMAPGVVILQVFMEPLFVIWTHNKIVFNPLLFYTLSLCVLVYAVSQPAIAIVNGNNLLKPQIFISTLSAITVIVGMFILVPRIGILGAGISLLTAEIIATTGYRYFAQRWLLKNELLWPKKQFTIAATSIWISAIGISLILFFPHNNILLLVIVLLTLIWNIRRYWRSLPILATQQAKKILCNLPGIGKIITT